MRADRQYNIARTVGVASLVAACGGDGPRDDRVIVTDSAGVTIVMSALPVWPGGEPALRLAAQPTVEIGVAGGDPAYELNGVIAAVRLSNGHIVIANARSSELRVYDEAGVFVRTIGRNGEGPGEFRNLGGLWRSAHDSIITFDLALRRITVFVPGGEPTRIFTLASPDPAMVTSAVGVLDNGAVPALASTPMTPSAGVGVHRVAGAVQVYDPVGEPAATLTTLPTEEWAIVEGATGVVLMPRAFGRSGLAVTDGRFVYVADNDRYDIAVYRPDGTLVRKQRRAAADVLVTSDVIKRYGEARLRNAGASEQARLAQQQMIDAMPFPERLPAFSRMIAAADGRLWVQATAIPGDATLSFSVFDANGEWLGDVPVPAGFRVMEIGADYVLGRWLDDLGVEHVRLYPLTMTAAPPT
ncbi:MAG: 6-bladed beta-propeller [Gemmatimonadetes bacterium]|nr:6-bladed beta-propeller [Gemmatimonadota bacterium]